MKLTVDFKNKLKQNILKKKLSWLTWIINNYSICTSQSNSSATGLRCEQANRRTHTTIFLPTFIEVVNNALPIRTLHRTIDSNRRKVIVRKYVLNNIQHKSALRKYQRAMASKMQPVNQLQQNPQLN